MIQRSGVTAKSSLDTALRYFAVSLERQIGAFGTRKFNRQSSSSQIRFDTSLRRLVQIASIVSFFGPSFPADDLTIPLTVLSDSIGRLTNTPTSLQRWVLPEVHAARRRLVGIVVGWLQSSAPEMEASEMIGEIRSTAERAGWAKDDVARLLLAFILTLTSNAPGTLSWAILHVVQAGTELTESLREEASQLIWGNNGQGSVDVTPASLDAGHAMPLTTDVILETMRLYSCVNAERYVETDTWLTVSPRARVWAVSRPKPGRSVSFSATPTPPCGSSRSSRCPSPALSRTSSAHTASLPSSMKGTRRSESPPPAPPVASTLR